MRPRVILHNVVSVDGRIDGFTGDVGLYYELAGRWEADAMLSGSNTILAALAQDGPSGGAAEAPQDPQAEPEDDTRQWLVVVDSRGRVNDLHRLREWPYWRGVIALCSAATPASHLEYLQRQRIPYVVAGEERVDLRAALGELNVRYGIRVVRVDSGGTLNGVLLRAGLVDEVSVLISPGLVGGTTPRSIFVAPDLAPSESAIPLRLLRVERLRGDTVWLRYEVVR